METIGQILRRARASSGVGTPASPSGARTLSEWARLERLAALPSTEAVQAGLARAMASQDGMPPERWEAFRAARQEVARWEELLAQAQERDELQASRPPDCWCLGMGGRGRYGLTLSPESETVWAFTTYCDCPDGRAMQDRATEAQADLDALRRPSLVAEKLARIELPERYRDFTLESFPVSELTRPACELMSAWADGGDYSVLLYGPASTGKTGLCVGGLKARVMREVRGGFYMPVTTLLGLIRQGYRQREVSEDQEDVFLRVKRVPFLLLDDLGKEKQTDWTDETLFELINERYTKRRLTLFTSNYDLDQLAERMDETKIDRIVQMCGPGHVLELQGPNLRTGAA
jgi:hypothetical protein